MLDNGTFLLYLLLFTFASFAILIVFCLKLRKRFQQKALELTSTEVWDKVKSTAELLNLSHSQLIFAVFQDSSPTEILWLVKDVENKIIGKIRKPMLGRKRYLSVGEQEFLIEFPMSWSRTAILYSLDNKILARYQQTGWTGSHSYEIDGYGKVTSSRSNFNFQGTWEYSKDSQKIGLKQSISSIKETGVLALLPEELSPAVRLFILSV